MKEVWERNPSVNNIFLCNIRNHQLGCSLLPQCCSLPAFTEQVSLLQGAEWNLRKLLKEPLYLNRGSYILSA